MKNYKYIRNEIFIDKSKMIKIILTITLAYFMLKKICTVDCSIDLIMYCYFIMSSTIVLIFLKQIQSFYSNKIISVINICFSGIMFLSLAGMMLCKMAMYGYMNYKLISYIIMLAIIGMEGIITCSINEYCFENKRIKKFFTIGIFIILFFIICVYLTNKYEFIKAIVFIFEIIIIVKIIKYMKAISLNKDGGLNILKCCFIFYILISIGNISNICVDFNLIVIDFVYLIHIISFKILANILMLNLIKEPYRERLEYMEKNNEKLEDINSEIILKNRNLEANITNLSSKEEIYSTFFKYMPHPVIVVSEENNRILFVNKKFLELVNITVPKNIINKKIDSLIEFLDDRENEIYDAIFKFNNITKFISIKYFKYDVQKRVMLIKDNTSKVEIEQLKKEIDNKRNQENIRTQFLSSISHDLKTPINVIYSVSQLQNIYIKKNDIKSIKKYNSICKTNCVNLIKLTNNLIDNSKIISDYLVPRLKKCNVVEIIEDNVMALVQYIKCNGLELVFDTNVEECYLNIDEEFMQRIILNLISNSIKYSKKNGIIEVSIFADKDDIRISVKDNGIGMKEEFQENAFDRYAVQERNQKYMKKSSGLGLFVVKQLVELQKGKILIQSKYNEGTNIIIILKRDNEQ